MTILHSLATLVAICTFTLACAGKEGPAWILVASAPGTWPTCGLGLLNTGRFAAMMTNAPVGWTAVFIVTYVTR
jgi:hypothetical protein